MAIQIQLRRGTASTWASVNPTLAEGELGLETDTGQIKVGTGTTAWNSLGYTMGDITGITAGTGLSGGGTSGSVTLSIDSTVVTLTGTQTLTNKTLTSPTLGGTSTYDHHAVASDSVTVSANSTPTTLDSFAVATYSTAEYVIQAKQGSKMTASHLTVMWDGTDVQVAEWGVVEGTGGAANVTFTATHSSGTVTVSASSSDAGTSNVVIKSSVTYIKA